MANGSVQKGGGISGFGVAREQEAPLSGSGGAAGPGTRAGAGEPFGEGIDTGTADPSDDPLKNEAAREAAALGSDDDGHDRTPALEYGEDDRPSGPTIGEALGSGAGEQVGSGGRQDHSNLASGANPASGESAAQAPGSETGEE